jgi:hypothetical protein
MTVKHLARRFSFLACVVGAIPIHAQSPDLTGSTKTFLSARPGVPLAIQTFSSTLWNLKGLWSMADEEQSWLCFLLRDRHAQRDPRWERRPT